jgi:AhpD family alkylhydroperoxidase
MSKNWLDITTEMSVATKELRAGTPNVMKEFSALARAALEPKALNVKTKELIALAISVATRCDPCIAFHAQSAIKQGLPATKSWKRWGWQSIWAPALRSCMLRKQLRHLTNSRV